MPRSAMKCLTRAAVPAAVAFLFAVATPTRAQDALHVADVRLLTVAERIQQANTALCDRRAPALGVALQSSDQFPAGADPGFAAPVAFAVVLSGGPAARSGIAENDGLVAIEGVPVAKLPALNDMPLRDSAYDVLAGRAGSGVLRLRVKRSGQLRDLELSPPAECRALVEIVAGGGVIARSDGRIIQISEGLAKRASDDELAVIFAHELSHAILHHRDRLSAQGVDKGLGGEFGRDRQLNGEAEIEADRLSVHLLANAGYDPRIAAGFWRGPLGRQISGGLFRSRIYSSPEGRAQMLEREIADYIPGGAPSWPGHLLARRGPSD